MFWSASRICLKSSLSCGKELGPEDVSLLEKYPHFRGWYVQASMELGPEDVSLLERCPHFRGWYVQASMELGPEDVSLLERCPHFRGQYVQASMELGPEDVSLLERCPHFRGWYVQGPYSLTFGSATQHFLIRSANRGGQEEGIVSLSFLATTSQATWRPSIP